MLVARFSLSADQWKRFRDFFKNNKDGILLKRDIGSQRKMKVTGHAVVAVREGFTRDKSGNVKGHWVIKNSWGSGAGHGGFFKIAKGALAMSFYYVH